MTALTAQTRFWDAIAPKYAAHTIKDMPGYERTLERTAELLTPADAVLELGCGTGTSALKLSPHVRRIHATDLSPAMIAIAREKAEAAGALNVAFGVATAGSAASEHSAYDAVLAFNLLHLVRDRAALFRHALEALKPGGLFISKTPCLSEMNPLIRLAVPLMRAIGKAPDVAFFGAEELETEIERSGFIVIERGRHASRGQDPRLFLVARKPFGAR